MNVIFDVDGCIIDSRRLIIDSYRYAGVSKPPNNILEYEGIDWLSTQGYKAAIIRKAKNAYYLQRLQSDGVATLPAYDVACRLAAEGHACLAYTGAPPGTINVLHTQLPNWPFRFACDGIRTPQRMKMFRLMSNFQLAVADAPVTGEGHVYIDDQSRLVKLPDGWRFVHYTTQDADQLYREIIQ